MDICSLYHYISLNIAWKIVFSWCKCNHLASMMFICSKMVLGTYMCPYSLYVYKYEVEYYQNIILASLILKKMFSIIVCLYLLVYSKIEYWKLLYFYAMWYNLVSMWIIHRCVSWSAFIAWLNYKNLYT